MKIAFTSTGADWDAIIDPRFGRTDFLLFYDEEKDELTHFDNRDVTGVAHGAGPRTSQRIYEHGAQVLITGNGPGGNAAAALKQMNIRIFMGAGGMTAREAYQAYKEEKLPQGA
jgi:predicted Fe-Mo cluster-binding NifX family protein